MGSLALVAPLEHPEHAVGDHEPADDIRHRRGDGHDAEQGGHRAVIRPGEYERAHERDPGDGVRRRHEWGVQQRRDSRNDLIPGECGEHEDVQLDKGNAAHAWLRIWPAWVTT